MLVSMHDGPLVELHAGPAIPHLVGVPRRASNDYDLILTNGSGSFTKMSDNHNVDMLTVHVSLIRDGPGRTGTEI